MNVEQKYQALNSFVTTADQRPASVELFYSYAHLDALLCQELRNHLTGLKRSGLIRGWYDHEIEPGSEWSVEIKEAMERAGIILLLVSADFLASEYINHIEVPFALERHQSGHAKIIPVLLRPVEWHDLPFAKLQVLPSGALAVTAWPNGIKRSQTSLAGFASFFTTSARAKSQRRSHRSRLHESHKNAYLMRPSPRPL